MPRHFIVFSKSGQQIRVTVGSRHFGTLIVPAPADISQQQIRTEMQCFIEQYNKEYGSLTTGIDKG